MDITVVNLQKKVRLNPAQIKKITRLILKAQKVRKYDLALIFVSHQKIRGLNQQFLKRNYATDVLAFDFNEKRNNRELFAEVIISIDAAIKHSKQYRNLLVQELSLYIIHGILHLTGHDDHKSKETKRMRSREVQILHQLGKKVEKIIR